MSGQPDPGRPDPGQPDPGRPDPGQPDRGRSGPPRWVVPAAVAAVAVVLLAVLVAVETGDDAGGGPRPADRVVAGPIDGRDEAQLDVVSGATAVTVRTADLGGDLYRVATPADSGLAPRVLGGGAGLQLHLVPDGEPGPSAVEIRLSSRVRWQLRLLGGSGQEVLDLAGGRLAGLTLAGGVTSREVSLPPPAGTVPVRLTGGAGDVTVHAPSEAPVRVRIGNGAGSLTVDGNRTSGIAPGTVVEPPEWARASDRYDLDAVAGVGTLVLDHG